MSLQCQQLACRRGDRILFSDLNFSLSEGELLFLEGRNGSGKTTLLKTLAGLRKADEGEIHWQGENIDDQYDEYRSALSWLGHLNGIKADLSALENLRIMSKLQEDNVSDNEIETALEKVGLAGYEDLPSHYLSQGQKRRSALAYFYFTKSKLWILDEPFTALDIKAVADLQQHIHQHVDKGGMVILTTHQDVDMLSGNIQRLRLDRAQ